MLYGLMAIAALLPSYLIRWQIFGLPMTMLEGMILVLTAVWLIKNKALISRLVPLARKLLFERSRELRRDWFFAILVFVLAATIATIISPNTRAAFGIWKAYFVEPILLFSVLISTVKTKEDAQKILSGLAVGAFGVALFAVIQKFTGWHIPNPFWRDEATRRVTSFFGYPNAVALYLGPIMPLMVWLVVETNKKRPRLFRIFLAVTILLSFLAIIFAKSTGALVALAAAAALIGLYLSKTRKLTLVALMAAVLLWPLLPGREQIASELWLKNISGKIRVQMWAETIEMLKSRPLLGAGLAGYQEAVRPYHVFQWAEIYLYPHNLILNFWSETGFLGLLAFAMLIWLYFKELRLAPRDGLTIALAASMLIILVHGLVDVPYFKNDLSVLFWILVGLALLNRRIK